MSAKARTNRNKVQLENNKLDYAAFSDVGKRDACAPVLVIEQ